MSKNTYLVGQQAFFDQTTLRMAQEQMFTGLWRLGWVYRSNWRVLHIDGFEAGSSLPESKGHRIQFYTVMGTCGGKGASIDPEPNQP